MKNEENKDLNQQATNVDSLAPTQLDEKTRSARKKAWIMLAIIGAITIFFYFRSAVNSNSSEQFVDEQNTLVSGYVDSAANALYNERQTYLVDSVYNSMSPAVIDSIDNFIKNNIDCDCPSIRDGEALDSVLREQYPNGIPDSLFSL